MNREPRSAPASLVPPWRFPGWLPGVVTLQNNRVGGQVRRLALKPTPDDTLNRALELFVEHNLLALPVVDDLESRPGIAMVRRVHVADVYLRHARGPFESR
ncbi:MAG: CBS domain-containing protein [Pirellulales bacterium]